ncbi:MAG: pyrroline-5-carboxylate reductase [Proteobacteria bacterium]|nr:pyrroline-5-carboxylate reductase [Pseudomonadota bacterium]MBI3497643.1 pyrroline-5-carboxylate reductase [Pseudomonadota bacterium]
MAKPVLLVGCGKMGGALLSGWLQRQDLPGGVYVIEPNAAGLGTFRGAAGVSLHPSAGDLPAGLDPEILVLAVKPQMMDAALPPLRRFTGATVLSIAAGKTLAYFSRSFGAEAPIVRSMPNTPASVGRGITVAVANARVSAAQRRRCHGLLAAVGQVEWVEDEGLLDAVTALSGGGPAYVFLLIECLAAAGAEAGLPADLAMRLARATVSGAGELARLSEGPASQLRQNVTSPGGTTLEALKVLMAEDGLQPLFNRAIAAATRRSRELAG